MAQHRARIMLLPLRELQPHEDPIPSHVEEVAASIAALGYVLKPIIVEEKTLTIIDGHHRYHALRRLGAHWAPVVLASYDGDIDAIGSKPKTVLVAARNQHEAVAHVASALEEASAKGPWRITIACGAARETLDIDLLDAYTALKQLAAARRAKSAKQFRVTVAIPPLSPRHVLRAAHRMETLPPRTTLHLTQLKKLHYPVKLAIL